MPEILCGVLCGAKSSGEARKTRTSVARRRSVAMRRLKIIPGATTTASEGEVEEAGKKRRKLDCCETEEMDKVIDVLLPPDLRVRRDVEELAKVPECTGKEVATKVKMPDPTEKEEVAVSLCPGYGMTSVRGRRREMEDAVSIRPEFLRRRRGRARGCHFFGVFDGHGCSHVAVSCKERMHEVVAEEVEDAAGDYGGAEALRPTEWKNVMERSFSRIDSEMISSRWDENCRCTLQPTNDHVGSTAVAAVVSSGHVVVANCGDSRAVLCRGGVAIPLSSDHKPDRPDELQRIQKAGGRVIFWNGARVLGVLAMSRAIGDNLLKPFVTAEPEVTVTEMTDDDEFLILASDGLWDVVSNSTACEVVSFCLQGSGTTGSFGDGTKELSEEERDQQGVSNKACIRAAILLTKLALARSTSDNVSVVVVNLRQHRFLIRAKNKAADLDMFRASTDGRI